MKASNGGDSPAEQPEAGAKSEAPKATPEELLEIADRISRLVQRPYLDHAELLYDEHGLPK